MIRILYPATAEFKRGKDKKKRKKRIINIGKGATLGALTLGGLAAIINRKNLKNPDTIKKIAGYTAIGAGIGGLSSDTAYRVRQKVENEKISLPGGIKVNKPRPFQKKPQGILNIRN